jgi:hypothetical protein
MAQQYFYISFVGWWKVLEFLHGGISIFMPNEKNAVIAVLPTQNLVERSSRCLGNVQKNNGFIGSAFRFRRIHPSAILTHAAEVQSFFNLKVKEKIRCFSGLF